MTDQELLEKVRRVRLADLSDAMDAIGLVNVGSMSSEMRPIRPGMHVAGFAYTAKLIPAQHEAEPYDTFEEFDRALAQWCTDTYAFVPGLMDGKGKDKMVVIDMGGYPGGVWGSEIGMATMKNGVAGAVVDGGCRDSYECNLEKVNVWCTKRTFNHVYGRVVNGGVNVPVQCAGVTVHPGDVVCADDDGVLVIPRDKAELVIEFAEAQHKKDQEIRSRHYKDLGYEYDETLGEFRPE